MFISLFDVFKLNFSKYQNLIPYTCLLPFDANHITNYSSSIHLILANLYLKEPKKGD